MSSLTELDKALPGKTARYGQSGYVLDYSDAAFGRVLHRGTKSISTVSKYQTYGTSKAKKLRAFWELGI